MSYEGRLRFYVSQSAPDATPDYVELTSRVDDGVQVPTYRAGRTNDLDQGDYGTLSIALDNTDDALTYQSPTSPYNTWWGLGARCKLTEEVVADAVTQDLFTGFLQMPEELVITEGVEQRVLVSAVDRLGRLSQGRRFISTMAAHVMGSVRNNALKGYWPLLDQGAPLAPAVGTGYGLTALSPTTLAPITQPPGFGYQGASPLPGDDVAPLQMTPGLNGTSIATFAKLSVDLSIPVAAGQVVTAVIWLNQDGANPNNGLGLDMTTDLGTPLLNIFPIADALGSHWAGVFDSIYGAEAATGCANATGRWYALAVRWGFTPNVMEIWVDGTQTVGSHAEVISNCTINGAGLIQWGAAAHLQIYVGDPADFTFTDFLAQRQVGLTGLERQTTGDRVRSILTYAGVPTAEWASTIDTGTSVMQAARLAGLDPLTPLRSAERTEQGLLYVDGSGLIHFMDRRTLYAT